MANSEKRCMRGKHVLFFSSINPANLPWPIKFLLEQYRLLTPVLMIALALTVSPS